LNRDTFDPDDSIARSRMKPTSGAVSFRFFCAAGAPKPTFQPT
jgi:hypothetical protein